MSSTWFDVIQRLLSHGHCMQDVRLYGMSQVLGFLGAIERLGRQDVYRNAFAIRMGSNADAKTWAAFKKGSL